MTEPSYSALPEALTSRFEAFIGSLPDGERAQLQQIVQASANQGEVQGYSATGTDTGWAAGVPEPIATRLNAFVGSLSPDEVAQLQAYANPQDGEVRGYVAVNTPPQNNNPTYGEFFNQLTQYVGGIVGAPFKPL